LSAALPALGFGIVAVAPAPPLACSVLAPPLGCAGVPPPFADVMPVLLDPFDPSLHAHTATSAVTTNKMRVRSPR
jgi:hypothetical protein